MPTIDRLAEELQAAAEVRVAESPPAPNVFDAVRRGTRRRLRNRVAVATGVVAFAAAGLAAARVVAPSTVREPRRVEVASGVRQIGRMTVPRAAHAATLLDDGTVLLSGGFSGDTEIYYDSAEVFDPATRTFLPAAPMATARTGHAGVLLDDGTVLVAGGWGGDFLSSAELYDPATRTFAATGSMAVARDGFTATKLRDGRVLVVGGFRESYETFNRSAEIYDPETGEFTSTGSLARARASHTATLLRDGRVAVAGGLGPGGVLRSIEVYDPATGTFTAGGRLTVARQKHGAALLDRGRVLLVGGADIDDAFGRRRSAEVYDPATGVARKAGGMRFARFKLPAPVNLPARGEVLVAGGADVPEVYEERSRSFVRVEGEHPGAHSFATATLLDDGSVLIAGGYDDDVTATDGAWLFTP